MNHAPNGSARERQQKRPDDQALFHHPPPRGCDARGLQHYWREEHAQLVERHAEALRIRRYLQTHAGDTDLDEALSGSRGSAPRYYDAVAELWWESIDDLLEASMSDEGQIAEQALLEDERRFIDLPNSPLWLGEENVVIEQS
jgi:hypothetical protein